MLYTIFKKLLVTASALVFGLGLGLVYALDESDFTNTGRVISAPTQFENNAVNNAGSVVVLPKGMTVSKVADTSLLSNPVQAGDVINYRITVDNPGLLGLTDITVVDSIIASSDISLNSGDINNDTVLDGDETWEFVGSYSVKQSDIDSMGGGDGDIDNEVTVSANEVPPETDSVEVAIAQAPAITVAKVVDQSTVSTPTTLAYTITVTNDGNQTLTGINLVDTLPDGTVAAVTGPTNDTGISNALDVGEVWEYSASYSVTQQDIDSAATLINTVDVTATETGSDVVQDTASTVITTESEFTVSKTVNVASIDSPQTLDYSVQVENTGNVSLTDVNLVDVLPDGTVGVLQGPTQDSGMSGVLDVGETWDYTLSYFVSQANIDSGADINNTVTVTTQETGLTEVSDNAITSISSNPGLVVEKDVDVISLNAPGDLNYTITLENTGNVSLTNPTVIDTLPSGTTATLVGPLNDAGIPGQIDVGEVWEYSAQYSVSQSEIDLGWTLVNTVEVTTDQTGATSSVDTAQTTIVRDPSFTVNKEVDSDNVTGPQPLNYEITIGNTGNVSLTNVQISDTLPNGDPASLVGPVSDVGTVGVIDVGEVWLYQGQYQVTQNDIDSGLPLVNIVNVITEEAGAIQDTAATTIGQSPSISVVKSVAEENFVANDDIVTFTFVVTNDGNVQLSDVTLQDNMLNASSIQCAASQPWVLQPGDSVECGAEYTIVASDVEATEVSNQASVVSSDPAGNEVSAISNTVVVPMLRIAPVASDNVFVSSVSSIPVTLLGADDDTDENGDLDKSSFSFVSTDAIDTDNDGDFDRLEVEGEGVWIADNATGTVLFTPIEGFTADPTVVFYVVSDHTDLPSNQASLTIEYPQTAPVAQNDYKLNEGVPDPSNPTSLFLLADNGDGVDSDAENDIDPSTITLLAASAVDSDGDGDEDLLVVPGEGLWAVNNGTGEIIFTPESGFLGDPTPIFYTVSDVNGLTSNEASVTVDYPQTAPVAVDDEKLNQPLGKPVTLEVLANDSDNESNINAALVLLIDPLSGEKVTSVQVPDEGEWVVDPATGRVTFTPLPGFIDSPTVIGYEVTDTTGLVSNVAFITITYEPPAALEGIVWLDSNRDGEVSPGEELKPNWILKIYDSSGTLAASTTTDENGFYSVQGLIPDAYTVEFFNESGVFMDSQKTRGVINSGELVNLPLPVDPGGVVYDSITRLPVSGVTLTLVNSAGIAVSDQCLFTNQQNQITELDGLYAFNLLIGSDDTCRSNDIYQIEIAETPDTYHPNFSSIIRQAGAQSCGDVNLGCAVSDVFDAAGAESGCTFDALPFTDACEVQSQPDAPTGVQGTQYFVDFLYQSGDRNVIFNHLPIDAKANDAQLLLSKRTDKRSVSVGSFVEYQIEAENTKDVPAVDIEVIDSPPADFDLVTDSVRLIRAGADGELGTADDVRSTLSASGNSPIKFEELDFLPGEALSIRYLMRVGVGVVPGELNNRVSAYGPNGLASNEATATVSIVADPVLQQATLVGKVFNDRDADGTQDAATATGVVLRSDYYGWNSLKLPSLAGRNSSRSDPAEFAVVINMPTTDNNAFAVSTREGTRIRVDENGTVSEAHVGDKARGMTGQDLRICTYPAKDVPTGKDGMPVSDGEVADVRKIVIQNYGINEEGIPGARLATVTGLLIETDAYGRYSIPDVDAGTTGIGQNFVLKVDPATLPQGSTFTTENPYVLRIINESLNKINFGVLVPDVDLYEGTPGQLCEYSKEEFAQRSVEVTLGSVFFDTDDHTIRADQRGVVQAIVSRLKEYGGGEIRIEAHTDSRASAAYNIQLAERRAETLRKILEKELGAALMKSVDVSVNPAGYQEQVDD